MIAHLIGAAVLVAASACSVAAGGTSWSSGSRAGGGASPAGGGASSPGGGDAPSAGGGTPIDPDAASTPYGADHNVRNKHVSTRATAAKLNGLPGDHCHPGEEHVARKRGL